MVIKPYILWGALGGVLPHIVQIAQQLINDRTADAALQSIVSIGYLIGLALLAIIGAIIVTSFREHDSRKALFLGISGPALITAAASTPNEPPEHLSATSPNTEIIGQHLFPQAFADANEPSINSPQLTANLKHALQARQAILQQSDADIGVIPRRYVEIYAVADSASFDILFTNKNQQAIQEIELPKRGHGLIAVPPNAEFIQFVNGENTSKPQLLPNNDRQLQGYFVAVKGKKVYGFKSVFGQAPSQELDFQISIKSLEPSKAGTEGWTYAGSFLEGTWAGKYYNFSENALPTPNRQQPYNVEYPLNLRQNDAKQSAIIGQLRLNQKVQVLEVTSKNDGNYWVKIKVLE